MFWGFGCLDTLFPLYCCVFCSSFFVLWLCCLCDSISSACRCREYRYRHPERDIEPKSPAPKPLKGSFCANAGRLPRRSETCSLVPAAGLVCDCSMRRLPASFDVLPSLLPLVDAVLLVFSPSQTGMLCIDLSSGCLLYTSPSPRDKRQSRMPSSA